MADILSRSIVYDRPQQDGLHKVRLHFLVRDNAGVDREFSTVPIFLPVETTAEAYRDVYPILEKLAEMESSRVVNELLRGDNSSLRDDQGNPKPLRWANYNAVLAATFEAALTAKNPLDVYRVAPLITPLSDDQIKAIRGTDDAGVADIRAMAAEWAAIAVKVDAHQPIGDN